MKILAIADRPASEPILDIIKKHKVDLICTLGDLGTYELAGLESIIDIPKIGVYGNHCSGNYFEHLGIQNMHLKTFEFGGLIFGGFEGSVRYKDSPYAKMYTQEEASLLLADFPYVDVMLTHCPPFGVNDDQTELAHTGFVALRDYVVNKKPKYLLHGHTYPKENEIVSKLEETQIIYVFGDKIVELVERI